jgi:ubiquinone/menaquinone biosynthesis C-methylase UbiE
MTHSQALNKYYRRTAPRYDETRFPWRSGPLGAIEVEEISKLIRASSILECGVGSGRFPQSFGKDHFFVGCDISKEMIKVCKKKLKSQNIDSPLILADAHNLPVAEDAFDCVMCSRTFKFLSNPDKFLKDAIRSLDKHGRCILSVAVLDSFWFKLAIKIGLIKLQDENAKTREYYYDKTEVTNLLKRAGFANINVIPVGNLLFGLYSFVWFNLYDTPYAYIFRLLPASLLKPLLVAGRENSTSHVLITGEKP